MYKGKHATAKGFLLITTL